MKLKILLIISIFIGYSAWGAKYTPVKILTNGDMSQASLQSTAIDLNQLDLTSIQAIWTGGSASGTLKIQVSNDMVDLASQVTHWTDYTGSDETVSGAGDVLWNMSFVGYRWVRMVYTRTSGSGSLNATFVGKGK